MAAAANRNGKTAVERRHAAIRALTVAAGFTFPFAVLAGGVVLWMLRVLTDGLLVGYLGTGRRIASAAPETAVPRPRERPRRRGSQSDAEWGPPSIDAERAWVSDEHATVVDAPTPAPAENAPRFAAGDASWAWDMDLAAPADDWLGEIAGEPTLPDTPRARRVDHVRAAADVCRRAAQHRRRRQATAFLSFGLAAVIAALMMVTLTGGSAEGPATSEHQHAQARVPTSPSSSTTTTIPATTTLPPTMPPTAPPAQNPIEAILHLGH